MLTFQLDFGPFIYYYIHSYSSYEKETVERINDIQNMDADTQSVLFNVMDTYIQNLKTKKAFAK